VTTTEIGNCIVCKTPLHPELYPEVSHPGCSPVAFFDEPAGPDPLAIELKRRLVEIILWADAEAPRSKQVQLGPSEISNPCDRAIAYRLAGIPRVNHGADPWAATVGTAIHAWLERAFNAYLTATGTSDWETEAVLDFYDGSIGHSDLYSRSLETVIDWKSASAEKMRKVRKDDIQDSHKTQVQIYGHGFAQSGRPVRKVALAYLPRSGRLRDMYIWVADYRPDIAEAALARPSRIAQEAVALDVLTQSHRWEQVPAFSSDDCGYCAFYNPMRTAETGASSQGCPGR
jgi:hypothetical protein